MAITVGSSTKLSHVFHHIVKRFANRQTAYFCAIHIHNHIQSSNALFSEFNWKYIFLEFYIKEGVYNSPIQISKNGSCIKKSSVRVSPPNLFTDIHLEATVNKSFIPSHRYTLGLSIFFLTVPTFCFINDLLDVVL